MPVISPDTFDPLNHYVSVRTPQGVPLVDADLNEADDIRSFDLRSFLRWYVEDGVPDGSDAFRIVGTGAADDVTISAGTAGPALPVGNIEVGLGFVGRCIVGGRMALIEADTTLRSQPLHTSQPGAAALAADWGVPEVPELPAVDATLLVYLDVWDRHVTADEEPSLVHAGLGIESASRLRREWVVRWTQAANIPTFGDADHMSAADEHRHRREPRRCRRRFQPDRADQGKDDHPRSPLKDSAHPVARERAVNEGTPP